MEINCDEKCRKVCFLWGGLGAVIPIVLSIAMVDYTKLADYYNTADMVELGGYGFRVIVFFLLGGLWAYLHKSEYEPLKLLQLGLVAPSLMATMISGSNLQEAKQPDDAGQSAFSFSIISSAYAQEKSGDEPKDKEEDVIGRFVKGFLGR